MFNIISNDCSAAFLYSELLNVEYQSVFNPTYLSSEDFLNLVEQYDTLDFTNFVVDGNTVTIDNLIHVQYNNYVEVSDIAYPCVTFDHEKLLVPDLKQFITERYVERLRRTLRNNNDVVFVFNEKPETTLEDELMFLAIKTPHKKLLYTSHEELIMCSNVDTIIEIVEPGSMDDKSYMNCAEVIKKYLF